MFFLFIFITKIYEIGLPKAYTFLFARDRFFHNGVSSLRRKESMYLLPRRWIEKKTDRDRRKVCPADRLDPGAKYINRRRKFRLLQYYLYQRRRRFFFFSFAEPRRRCEHVHRVIFTIITPPPSPHLPHSPDDFQSFLFYSSAMNHW